ncbi:MAG: peptidase [Chlamydiae bacterium CG10_big_fil_rev_8_21_14_0_10_42_34]|nr:MAG: peptidase [Chlamydiae bacterium CG10_big_fil_rev_8_21_14_0_10_42_34]
MTKVQEAQKYLKELGLDGWLLYDFHGNNELARLFLGLTSDSITTRRFFYWIPVKGEPIKIVHAIESHVLDQCAGEKRTFLSWQSLEKEVGRVLKGVKKIAMEYSFKNAIPYISRVDAGTVDLVRSFGVEVVSSGDFLANFTAVLSDEQGQSQIRAGKACDRIVNGAWKWICEQLVNKNAITEYDVQQKIVEEFKKSNLVTDHPPIVAVNAHSADPHYEPLKVGSSVIQRGDFILIDLWAKENVEGAVYGDITRVAVAANKPTDRQLEIFQIVRSAQIAALELVTGRFSQKKRVEGWEVDQAARRVIEDAGYGEFFIHRTGHSIEVSLHGSGAHMDDLEMHDVRPLLPGTCFSIEPGIYLPDEFGVRLEHDVYIHPDGTVEVTGGIEDSLLCLF